MAIMEISIIPLGTKTPSVNRYIADALRILGKEKNITYELTAMGTIVQEDSLDLLLTLAKKMHRAVLGEKIKRVVTTIKIDDRKDKKISIEEKVRSANP